VEPARAFAGVLSHRLWLCLRTGKRKKYSQKPGLATPGNGSAGHRQSLSQPPRQHAGALYQRSADYSRGCSLRPVHRADDRRHAVLVSGLFQEPGQRRLSLFIRRKTALHRSDGNDDLPVCTPVSPKPSGDRSGAENFGSRRQPGDDRAKASSRGEAAVGPGVYHSGGFPSDGGFHECERLRPAGENPVQKNPVCLAGWSAFGGLFGRIGVFSSSFWDGEA